MAQISSNLQVQEEDLPEEILNPTLTGSIVKPTKPAPKPKKSREVITSPAQINPPEAVLDPRYTIPYVPNPAGTSPAVPADLINQHIINQIPQQDRPAALNPNPQQTPSTGTQPLTNYTPAGATVAEEDLPNHIYQQGAELRGPNIDTSYHEPTAGELWGNIIPGFLWRTGTRAAKSTADFWDPFTLGKDPEAAKKFFLGQADVGIEGQEIAKQTGNPWEAYYRYALAGTPILGPNLDRLINGMRAGDLDETADALGDLFAMRYGPKVGEAIASKYVPKMLGMPSYIFANRKYREFKKLKGWEQASEDLRNQVAPYQNLGQEGTVQMASGVAKQTMEDLQTDAQTKRDDIANIAKATPVTDYRREAEIDPQTGKQATDAKGNPKWNTFPIEGPVNVARTQTIMRPVYEYFQRQLARGGNSDLVTQKVLPILGHLENMINRQEGSYTQYGYPKLKGPVMEWDRAEPLSRALGDWLETQGKSIPSDEEVTIQKFKDSLDKDIDTALGQYGPRARTAYNAYQDALQKQKEVAGPPIAQVLRNYAINPKTGYENVANAAVDGLSQTTARQFKALTKNPKYLQDLTMEKLFTKYDTSEGFDFDKALTELRQHGKFYGEAVDPVTLENTKRFLLEAQSKLSGKKPEWPGEPFNLSGTALKAAISGVITHALDLASSPDTKWHQATHFGTIFSNLYIGTGAMGAIMNKLMSNRAFAEGVFNVMNNPANSLPGRVGALVVRNALRGTTGLNVIDANNKRRPAAIGNDGQLILGAPQ